LTKGHLKFLTKAQFALFVKTDMIYKINVYGDLRHNTSIAPETLLNTTKENL